MEKSKVVERDYVFAVVRQHSIRYFFNSFMLESIKLILFILKNDGIP